MIESAAAGGEEEDGGMSVASAVIAATLNEEDSAKHRLFVNESGALTNFGKAGVQYALTVQQYRDAAKTASALTSAQELLNKSNGGGNKAAAGKYQPQQSLTTIGSLPATNTGSAARKNPHANLSPAALFDLGIATTGVDRSPFPPISLSKDLQNQFLSKFEFRRSSYQYLYEWIRKAMNILKSQCFMYLHAMGDVGPRIQYITHFIDQNLISVEDMARQSIHYQLSIIYQYQVPSSAAAAAATSAQVAPGSSAAQQKSTGNATSDFPSAPATDPKSFVAPTISVTMGQPLTKKQLQREQQQQQEEAERRKKQLEKQEDLKWCYEVGSYEYVIALQLYSLLNFTQWTPKMIATAFVDQGFYTESEWLTACLDRVFQYCWRMSEDVVPRLGSGSGQIRVPPEVSKVMQSSPSSSSSSPAERSNSSAGAGAASEKPPRLQRWQFLPMSPQQQLSQESFPSFLFLLQQIASVARCTVSPSELMAHYFEYRKNLNIWIIPRAWLTDRSPDDQMIGLGADDVDYDDDDVDAYYHDNDDDDDAVAGGGSGSGGGSRNRRLGGGGASPDKDDDDDDDDDDVKGPAPGGNSKSKMYDGCPWGNHLFVADSQVGASWLKMMMYCPLPSATSSSVTAAPPKPSAMFRPLGKPPLSSLDWHVMQGFLRYLRLVEWKRFLMDWLRVLPQETQRRLCSKHATTGPAPVSTPATTTPATVASTTTTTPSMVNQQSGTPATPATATPATIAADKPNSPTPCPWDGSLSPRATSLSGSAVSGTTGSMLRQLSSDSLPVAIDRPSPPLSTGLMATTTPPMTIPHHPMGSLPFPSVHTEPFPSVPPTKTLPATAPRAPTTGSATNTPASTTNATANAPVVSGSRESIASVAEDAAALDVRIFQQPQLPRTTAATTATTAAVQQNQPSGAAAAAAAAAAASADRPLKSLKRKRKRLVQRPSLALVLMGGGIVEAADGTLPARTTGDRVGDDENNGHAGIHQRAVAENNAVPRTTSLEGHTRSGRNEATTMDVMRGVIGRVDAQGRFHSVESFNAAGERYPTFDGVVDNDDDDGDDDDDDDGQGGICPDDMFSEDDEEP